MKDFKLPPGAAVFPWVWTPGGAGRQALAAAPRGPGFPVPRGKGAAEPRPLHSVTTLPLRGPAVFRNLAEGNPASLLWEVTQKGAEREPLASCAPQLPLVLHVGARARTDAMGRRSGDIHTAAREQPRVDSAGGGHLLAHGPAAAHGFFRSTDSLV